MKSAIRKPIDAQQDAFIARELVESHFYPNWHFHLECELFFVLTGTGTRFVGDSIRPLLPGELIFVGANLPHLFRSDKAYFQRHADQQANSIVVYFREDFLGEDILTKNEMLHLRSFLCEASRRGFLVTGQTRKTVSKAMIELASQERGLRRIILLLQILGELAHSTELQPLASEHYRNSMKPNETDRMQKVHEFVLKNFQEKVELTKVADLIGMAPTAFSRYFKQIAHKTFSEFVIGIRIGHACKLLMDKRFSVAQIAYESGFGSLSNFNEQFKKTMGLSPLAYYHQAAQINQ